MIKKENQRIKEWVSQVLLLSKDKKLKIGIQWHPLSLHKLDIDKPNMVKMT